MQNRWSRANEWSLISMKGLYQNDHISALQTGPDMIVIFGAGEYSRDNIFKMSVKNETVRLFSNIKL